MLLLKKYNLFKEKIIFFISKALYRRSCVKTFLLL